jgi:hypothetical protein
MRHTDAERAAIVRLDSILRKLETKRQKYAKALRRIATGRKAP